MGLKDSLKAVLERETLGKPIQNAILANANRNQQTAEQTAEAGHPFLATLQSLGADADKFLAGLIPTNLAGTALAMAPMPGQKGLLSEGDLQQMVVEGELNKARDIARNPYTNQVSARQESPAVIETLSQNVEKPIPDTYASNFIAARKAKDLELIAQQKGKQAEMAKKDRAELQGKPLEVAERMKQARQKQIDNANRTVQQAKEIKPDVEFNREMASEAIKEFNENKYLLSKLAEKADTAYKYHQILPKDQRFIDEIDRSVRAYDAVRRNQETKIAPFLKDMEQQAVPLTGPNRLLDENTLRELINLLHGEEKPLL